MTHSHDRGYAPSGSIHIAADGDEEEFRRMRDEICADFAAQEGTRMRGQLTPAEFAVTVLAIVAAFVGILLCR